MNFVFPPLQALLLPTILLLCEMKRVPPAGSSFVGFRCTNEDCLRVFTLHSKFQRHKQHPSNSKTPCANPKMAEVMYQINDSRPASLQPSRIITFPVSGNKALPFPRLRTSCAVHADSAFFYQKRIKTCLRIFAFFDCVFLRMMRIQI
jgi:hypothetical protein